MRAFNTIGKQMRKSPIIAMREHTEVLCKFIGKIQVRVIQLSPRLKNRFQEVTVFGLRAVYLIHLFSSHLLGWDFCFDHGLLLSNTIHPLNFEPSYHVLKVFRPISQLILLKPTWYCWSGREDHGTQEQ